MFPFFKKATPTKLELIDRKILVRQIAISNSNGLLCHMFTDFQIHQFLRKYFFWFDNDARLRLCVDIRLITRSISYFKL